MELAGKVTEADVRTALLDAAKEFNTHIIATVTNRVNASGQSVDDAYIAVMRDRAEASMSVEGCDLYGGEPEWSNPGPHDGYRARKHVDAEYHGESFHQGE